MKPNTYLVLDTETARPLTPWEHVLTPDQKKAIAIAKPLIYDVGYVIMTTQGHITAKINYLVKEIWENEALFNTAYYAYKKPLYQKMLDMGAIQVKPWREILQIMAKDLSHVKMSCAFNACFDFKKAIPYTCEYIYHLDYKKDFTVWYEQQIQQCALIASGKKWNGHNDTYMNPEFVLFKKAYPITDLWTLACERLLNTRTYKQFCMKNNRFTNSVQFFTTNAEVVFQYLTKDEQFNESHTALDDAIIEAEILYRVLRKGKITPTITAFPFRALGTTLDYAKHSPKYKPQIIKALRAYIDKNDGWDKAWYNSYWARIVGIYDNL